MALPGGSSRSKGDGFHSLADMDPERRGGVTAAHTEKEKGQSWLSRMAGRQLKAPFRGRRVPSLAEWLVEREVTNALFTSSSPGAASSTAEAGEPFPGTGSPMAGASPAQFNMKPAAAYATPPPNGAAPVHLLGTSSGGSRRKFQRRLVKGTIRGGVISAAASAFTSRAPSPKLNSSGVEDADLSEGDLNGIRLESGLTSVAASPVPAQNFALAAESPGSFPGKDGGLAWAFASRFDLRSPSPGFSSVSPMRPSSVVTMATDIEDPSAEEAALVLLPRVPALRKPEAGTVATLHTPPSMTPAILTSTSASKRCTPRSAAGPRRTAGQSRKKDLASGAPGSRAAAAAAAAGASIDAAWTVASSDGPRAPETPKGKTSPLDRKWHLRQASLSVALAQSGTGPESGTDCVRHPANSMGLASRSTDDNREYLSFAGWSLDDDYMCTLLCKVGVSRMRHINVADNRLTAAAMELLREASRVQSLASLQSLRLANNPLGPTGGHVIARLIHEAKPPLKELDMSENGIGDQACEELCEALAVRCPSLVGLSFAKNKIGLSSNPGTALGALIAGASCLQALDLHWNRFHGAGAAAVIQGLYDNACDMQGQLWRVNLAWNTIGLRCKGSHNHPNNGGVAGVAGMDKSQDCRCETCRSCTKVVSTLASVFSDGKTLFHLDISHNSLGVHDCTQLAEAIRTNHTLFGLHLEGNAAMCDDVGFIVVSGEGGSEKLHELEAVRSELNHYVRHMPQCFRLEKVGNIQPRNSSSAGSHSTRTLALANAANLKSSPSLHKLLDSDAFSTEDIDIEKRWAEERAKVQRPMDFGSSRQFDDARMNERCCWICENWIQETVSYIPGWSGPQTSLEDACEVFAYFSTDGFQRPTRLAKTTERYLERVFSAEAVEGNVNLRRRKSQHRCGTEINAHLVHALPDGDSRTPVLDEHGRYYVFKGSRMLPPSVVPIKVVFQVHGAIVCADNMLKVPLPEIVKVRLHQGGKNPAGNTAKLPPVPIELDPAMPPAQVTEANAIWVGLSALDRFDRSQATALCLMEDPRQRSDLEVVPRKTQFDRVLKVRQAWTYETSIFKDYHRETPPDIAGCFEHDFAASKLEKYMEKYVKGRGCVNNTCNYLRKHYDLLMAAYHKRAFQGFTLSRCSAGMSLLQFTEVLAHKSIKTEPDPPGDASEDKQTLLRSKSGLQGSVHRPTVSTLTSGTGSPQSAIRDPVRSTISGTTHRPGPKHVDSEGPVFNEHFHRVTADTIYIAGNVVDKTNPMTKDMIALPGSGLARFQFLEAFVRAALARFYESKEKDTAEAAVKELMRVLNVGCQPHHWRATLQKILFVEECDMIIRRNLPLLQEAFTIYSKRHRFTEQAASKTTVTYGAWHEFLEACNADEFGVNLLNYGVAFAIGKEIRVDEYRSYRHMELSSAEFLVCIGATVRLSAPFEENAFPDKLLEFIEDYIPRSVQHAHAGGHKAHAGGNDAALSKVIALVGNVFVQADEDCSGSLSFKEFNSAVRQRSMVHSFKELGIGSDDFRVLFRMIDTDKSGTVTLDELIDGIIKMRKTMVGLERAIAFLRHAFEEADRDHSGTISKEEFLGMLKSSSVIARLQAIGISVEDLDDLWNAVDAAGDSDGTDGVSSDEMISGLLQIRDEGNAKVLGLNHLRQAFKAADANGGGSLSVDEIAPAFYADEVTAKLDKLGLFTPDWVAVFTILDANSDGELSWDELSKGITTVWEANALASPQGHTVPSA